MSRVTHIRDGGFDWHRDDRVSRDEGYSTFLIAREAARLIAAHDPGKPLFLYVPFNAVHAPHQVPEKYKEPYAQFPEPRRTYAGMVAAMDEAIGTIIAALEQRGLREKTLILFSSDNGGPQPGKVTSNGPLRAGKATLYEGGTRVPALAVWPGRIQPGSVVNEPLHVVDWYPTLLKLAGAPLEQKLPLDGKDAWPTLVDGQPSPHAEILINATPTSGAIRVGDWKLIWNGRVGAGEGESAAGSTVPPAGEPATEAANAGVELFNLARDPYEQTNLAAAEPGKVKALRARLDAFAKAAVPPKAAPAAKDFKAPKVWGEPD